MVLSLLLMVTTVLIPETSAEDCHHVLYTESLVRHINYTGRPCRWTIIAPVSQRIWFTLQKLTVQIIDGQCASMLTVYDEESAAPALCQDVSNGMDYISDRNMLHLNITNVYEATSITTIEATFYPAVQYFFCDFSSNTDCTRRVQQTSSWMYSVGGNDLCPIPDRFAPRPASVPVPNEFAIVPLSGVFYQAASVSATLRITSLPSGRYIVSATVIAGCSPFDQNQAINVTFCNRTKTYFLAPNFRTWRIRTIFIQCHLESEAIIQATPGTMVVAMDNIRLTKAMDEIPLQSTPSSPSTNSLVTLDQTQTSVPVQSTTSSPSTNSSVTLDQRQTSGFPLLIVLVVSGSAVLFLIVIGVFLVCILCRKRRKTVRDAPETPSRIHYDNRTYDTHISSQTPALIDRSPEYAEVNKNYSSSPKISSKPVSAVRNNVTEGYNYIRSSPNQGYESTVVTDHNYSHQLSQDQEHTYNDISREQGAHGDPENAYQVVNNLKMPRLKDC